MSSVENIVSVITARHPLLVSKADRSRYETVRDRSADRPAMYQNQNERLGIDFEVERLDFSHREALDPRIVRIAPNKRNEYHKHAHESLFVILSGRGLIIIDSEEIEANQGDVLFVPRWVFHQTVNASSTEDLVLLAVTDFGLTSSVLGDYDKRTRLQDGGIDVKGGAPHTPSDQEGRRQGEKV